MTETLYCPKCYSTKVQPTFSIGKSKKENIICNCGYYGLAPKATTEYLQGLKEFSNQMKK